MTKKSCSNYVQASLSKELKRALTNTGHDTDKCLLEKHDKQTETFSKGMKTNEYHSGGQNVMREPPALTSRLISKTTE